MPRAERRAQVLGAIVLLAVALSGCARGGDPTPVPTPTHLGLETIAPDDTGTNGIEHLAGADVLTESLGAVGRAEGVQFTFASSTPAGTLEVQYAGRPDASTATIVTADGELEVVVVEGSGFVRGTGNLAARYGATDDFACRSLDDPAFGDFGAVLDLQDLLRTLTSTLALRRGALTEGDPPTVDVVLETSSGAAGLLVVTASGEPLPISLVLADETGSATLDIDGWDAVAVEAPATC